MKTLEEMLWDYGKDGRYPFHMPGHKRNSMQSDEGFAEWFNEIHRLDITEITDFDNLHHPDGVIRQLEEELGAFYHTKRTYPLVGGSTAGILSAISACTDIGDEILIARNCHKSVLNACMLRNLRPHFLYPEWIPECGIYGGILPEHVDEYLKKHKNIKAVVVVSPTYEGIVSDIHKIAEVVHRFGIPLIVDEAHGAHFSYREGDSAFSVSATAYADLVVQSLHKTLPCMTQTALLHANGDLVDGYKLERCLESFQTSSPSYVMMADISHCFHYMKQHRDMMNTYEKRLTDMRAALDQLQFIRLPGKKDIGKYGIFDYDIGKLVFVPRVKDLSGSALFKRLRDGDHLELEMCGVFYCIAMTSPLDTQEGYERLKDALTKMNEEYIGAAMTEKQYVPCCVPEPVMTPYEAEWGKAEAVSYERAEGRVSARNLYVYPPGVAFVTAGERIDENVMEQIKTYEKQGFEIHGISEQGMLMVVI
jgi:arginine/lysine/ornithine decarboxylase